MSPSWNAKLISERAAGVVPALLLVVALTLSGVGRAQLQKVEKKRPAAPLQTLSKEFLTFQSSLNRAASLLRFSVIRLEIHRSDPFAAKAKSGGKALLLPAGSRSMATAVVVHPGVVVTVEEALNGAGMVVGYCRDPHGRIQAVRLRLLGSCNDVAVLTGYYEGLPKFLKPVGMGKTVDLDHGSMAFLADGGTESHAGVALPAALYKMDLSRLKDLPKGTRAKIPYLLGLKGVAMTQVDRGGLVCNSSMAMLGLARGAPSPQIIFQQLSNRTRKQGRAKPQTGLVRQDGKGDAKANAIRNFMIRARASLANHRINTVIPVERVLEAADRVQARAGAVRRRTSSLGIQCPWSNKRVDQVFFGSPAHRAGMKVGDLITHWNGRDVTQLRNADLKKTIASDLARQKRCKVTVRRGGKAETLTIETGF